MADIRDKNRELIGAEADNVIRKAIKEVVFAAASRASLSTSLVGTNNDLDFSAVLYGKSGNNITIAYVDPGLPSQSLSVSVSGNAITVNLATNGGTDEVQTLTVLGSSGTFSISFRDQTTIPLPYDSSAAVVQAALRALPTINGANVNVSKSSNVYTITFVGTLAATNVPALQGITTMLNPVVPTITHATTQAGDGTHNEIQTVTLNNARGGRFTLTYSGQTTTPINYGATAAAVATALKALSNIGDSDVDVSKSGDVYTVTFQGALGNTNVAQLTSTSGLQGIVAITTATTTPGAAYSITSTASQVKTAIDASTAAKALVTAANTSGNNGSGVVTAMNAQPLAGGANGVGSVESLAKLTTSLTGTNNDLVFTAIPLGVLGNGITVTYVDPAQANQALAVTVDVQRRTITVSLATDGSSVITSTAAQVKAAIDGNTDAAALVTIANASTNDGTGVVTAMSASALTGGAAAAELFQVEGQVQAAVIGSPSVSLAGASATFKVGVSSDDDLFVAQSTATNVTAGKTVDSTGVLAAGTAPNMTPHSTLNDGDVIKQSVATANITGGSMTYCCFYRQLTPGSRVLPVA